MRNETITFYNNYMESHFTIKFKKNNIRYKNDILENPKEGILLNTIYLIIHNIVYTYMVKY